MNIDNKNTTDIIYEKIEYLKRVYSENIRYIKEKKFREAKSGFEKYLSLLEKMKKSGFEYLQNTVEVAKKYIKLCEKRIELEELKILREKRIEEKIKKRIEEAKKFYNYLLKILEESEKEEIIINIKRARKEISVRNIKKIIKKYNLPLTRDTDNVYILKRELFNKNFEELLKSKYT